MPVMSAMLSRFVAWLPPINEGGGNFQANLDTPLVALQYNKLPWGKHGVPLDLRMNYGGHFANGVWTPPKGFIQMSCSVRCYEGLEQNQVITAKWTVGNNDPYREAPAAVGDKGNYEGTDPRDSVYVPKGTVMMECNGVTTFDLKLYTTDASLKVDAVQAHTWWCGVCWATE